MPDPLYTKIRAGLEGLGDGNAFEACAASLLRSIYPTLVPVEGGSDQGFDGRAASDAHVIQLICTICGDVIGNVTGSLDEAKRKGRPSSAVVIATSRSLTPVQRVNLEKRVGEYGKRLIEIHDQASLADLLYRDSRWRKDLLGISGLPPALSSLPVNHRPSAPIKLIGRDDEFSRLTTLTGDLIVVGQPGAGKTHLLLEAARAANGLFVVSDDSGAIADGLRDQRPAFVVVDDAAAVPGLAQRLRQIRVSTGAQFHLVATCWPGQQEALARELGTTAAPLELEPLPQAFIREIIYAMRIQGPPELVQELLNQALGKPGLAVTLCQLCWQDSVNEVVHGTALAKDVRQTLVRLAGEAAVGVLAYFALGGETGLDVKAVATLTGRTPLDVRELAVKMSVAGVLDVKAGEFLVVQPLRLRQALVRDYFLSVAPLDWTPALQHSPDPRHVMLSAIGGALLGGTLDEEFVRGWLLQQEPKADETTQLCVAYAHLGPAQATWIIEHFIQKAVVCAQPLLEHVPEVALPRLLILFDLEGIKRPNDREALRPIRDWIDVIAAQNAAESLRRRGLLLTALEFSQRFMTDQAVVGHTLRIILNPEFEFIQHPPGEPDTIRFCHGCMPIASLSGLAAFWHRAWTILRGLSPEARHQFVHTFHHWIHPGAIPAVELHPDYEKTAHQLVGPMLADMASLATWAHRRLLDEYGRKAGLPALAASDPLADVLYPEQVFENLEAANLTQKEAANRLVAQWRAQGPRADLLATWVRIDAEAAAAGVNYPDWGRYIAETIAGETAEPAAWLDALIAADARVSVAEHFAFRCARDNPAGIPALIARFIVQPKLEVMGVEILLRFADATGEEWKTHSPLISKYSRLTEHFVMRAILPEPTLAALLQFPDAGVRGTTAARLWTVYAETGIPAVLFPAWRQAVIEVVEDRHELANIVGRHPDVACEWLIERVARPAEHHRRGHFLSLNNAVDRVIAGLSREQRKLVIQSFSRVTFEDEIIGKLVGDDLDLLKFALINEATREAAGTCLALDKPATPEWIARALICIAHGYQVKDILAGTTPRSDGWSGKRSDHLEEWRLRYAPLLDHPNEVLREAARIADASYAKDRDMYRKAERAAAVRGRLA